MIDTGKKVSVLGKEYPVQLTDGNDYTGMKFHVDLGDGNELEAASFHELASLAANFKDVRFDLPFTSQDGYDGSVTGFHAGNGRLLVRWANGKTEQRYGIDGAMPQLQGEDRETFHRLLKTRNDAQQAVKEFVQAHEFPDGVKRAAIGARIKKGGLA
jgi:hypothetical protein